MNYFGRILDTIKKILTAQFVAIISLAEYLHNLMITVFALAILAFGDDENA